MSKPRSVLRLVQSTVIDGKACEVGTTRPGIAHVCRYRKPSYGNERAIGGNGLSERGTTINRLTGARVRAPSFRCSNASSKAAPRSLAAACVWSGKSMVEPHGSVRVLRVRVPPTSQFAQRNTPSKGTIVTTRQAEIGKFAANRGEQPTFNPKWWRALPVGKHQPSRQQRRAESRRLAKC